MNEVLYLVGYEIHVHSTVFTIFFLVIKTSVQSNRPGLTWTARG